MIRERRMKVNTRESRNRYLTGLLVILLLSASGWAQESPPETAAEPTATPETVPLAYRSARATMDTFLSAFYLEDGPDLQRAVGCLDLSRLSPAVGARHGAERATVIASRLPAQTANHRLMAATNAPS